MALFEDRKKGEESRYARDQELTFKATARRNKLLGLWVADRLGKTGAEADAYAREVIEADFERPGIDDVVEKVLADCRAAGLAIDEHLIRRKIETLGMEARRQIESE